MGAHEDVGELEVLHNQAGLGHELNFYIMLNILNFYPEGNGGNMLAMGFSI